MSRPDRYGAESKEFVQGRLARIAGRPITSCPYMSKPLGARATRWKTGWLFTDERIKERKSA